MIILSPLGTGISLIILPEDVMMGFERGRRSSLMASLKVLWTTGWYRSVSYRCHYEWENIGIHQFPLTFTTADRYGIASKSEALNSDSPRDRILCCIVCISWRNFVCISGFRDSSSSIQLRVLAVVSWPASIITLVDRQGSTQDWWSGCAAKTYRICASSSSSFNCHFWFSEAFALTGGEMEDHKTRF